MIKNDNVVQLLSQVYSRENSIFIGNLMEFLIGGTKL